MTKLVTLGCSWVKGVGAKYSCNNPDDESTYLSYRSITEQNAPYAWRTLLANKYNLEQHNIAQGGSANQTQFRLAQEYFNTVENPKDIIVLWGVTSIYRDELYFNQIKEYKPFIFNFQSKRADDFERKTGFNSMNYYRRHFNEKNEYHQLTQNIKHWQQYFDLRGIRHKWFDTLNQTNTIHNNAIVFPHKGMPDLMSQMTAEVSGAPIHQDRMHFSNWLVDSSRIQRLIDNNVVNPHSLHPSQEGSKVIANLLDKHVQSML